MSMSDCIMCYETPCVCGWGYITYSHKRLLRVKEMIDKVILFKAKHPDACYMTELDRIEIWNAFEEELMRNSNMLEEKTKESEEDVYVEEQVLKHLNSLMKNMKIYSKQ